MIYIFIATVIMIIVFVAVYIKKEKYNDLKYDEELSPIIEKLGDNLSITKEILKKSGNSHTNVKYNLDEKANISYYDHSKDIIVMQKCKNDEYMRIIHIAHECVHTIQKKSYLIMNKTLSNIQILYFLFLMIFFFYTENNQLKIILSAIQILIWFATVFVKIVIESDACYRSILLASDYLKDKLALNEVNKFIEKTESKIYDMIPMYYMNFLIQGGAMVLIVQMVSMLKGG